MKLQKLQCDGHGEVLWNGEVVCSKCGRVYTTRDPSLDSHAPRVCACGTRLMPGKRRGQRFSARPCCSKCYLERAGTGALQ